MRFSVSPVIASGRFIAQPIVQLSVDVNIRERKSAARAALFQVKDREPCYARHSAGAYLASKLPTVFAATTDVPVPIRLPAGDAVEPAARHFHATLPSAETYGTSVSVELLMRLFARRGEALL